MWLYTKLGFYSVVLKRGDARLSIRSYVKQDLVNLIHHFELQTEIWHTPDADYNYRIKLEKEEFAQILTELILQIDYSNFKAEISTHEDFQRLIAYHDIHDITSTLKSACTHKKKSR